MEFKLSKNEMNDLLKQWILFRDEELSTLTNEDKKHSLRFDEFEEKRYLSQAEFDEYFAEIRQKAYKVKAKTRYATSGKNYPLYMVLFPSKDQDIIDRLEEMKETAESKHATKGGRNGKSDYIRKLIREDIEKNKGR